MMKYKLSFFILGVFSGTLLALLLLQLFTSQKREETSQTSLSKNHSISLSDLLKKVHGVDIIPFDPMNPAHLSLSHHIHQAAQRSLDSMNTSDSAAQTTSRINEVSRVLEDLLFQNLDLPPEFQCRIPLNKQGKERRSGYPDLEVLHIPTQTRAYLDPKLYASQQTNSSFRSFYYTPFSKHHKANRPALHLLLGVRHEQSKNRRVFGTFRLHDLSSLALKLKEEYHASNQKLYQTPLILPHESPLPTLPKN